MTYYNQTQDQQGQQRRQSPESVITLNLMALRGVSVISHEGVQYIAIPVQDNPTLYIGRDEISLDINVYRKDPQHCRYGETHYVRPSLGSRARSGIPRERWNEYTSIMGNVTPFEVILSRSQHRVKDDRRGQYGNDSRQRQNSGSQHQAESQRTYSQQGQYAPGRRSAPPVYGGEDMPEF